MRKRQRGVSIYRPVHCSSEWRHTGRDGRGIESGLEILERKHNGGSETVTVTHKYNFTVNHPGLYTEITDNLLKWNLQLRAQPLRMKP